MQHYQLICKGELNWKNVLLIINKLLHIIFCVYVLVNIIIICNKHENAL